MATMWQIFRAAHPVWSTGTEGSGRNGSRKTLNSQIPDVFNLAEDTIKDAYDMDRDDGKYL